MNLEKTHTVYLIGIGGIGMSALAAYFRWKDCVVAGYDRAFSSITESLQEQGIEVIFKDEKEAIPQQISSAQKENTLVVYTPAVPKDHPQLMWFQQQGYEVKKRSEVLASVVENKTVIAIAGTHGKTTTAAFVSHLLKEAGKDFYAFIGGIAANFGSNYHLPENEIASLAVVEADEFDRSFHRLQPDTAIITSIDADHLDIYGSEKEIVKAYQQFADRVKASGRCIFKESLSITTANADSVTFGFDEESTYRATNINIKEGIYYFDIEVNNKEWISNAALHVPGKHNILNCLAAVSAVAPMIDDTALLRDAIASFRGVGRRFQKIFDSSDVVYIDDYAHHPEELRNTIETARSLYPQKKLTGVFQPHLYSRTRDFAEGFAQSLSALDEVILLEIYPARELPIEGVSSQMLLNLVSAPEKKLHKPEELLDRIENEPLEVLLTMGAGDIDRLVEPIKKSLQKKTAQVNE